ncbi:hypothetical protein EJ110_NYTH52550 [Nymphaea thermarum]|nr:hypothetical protein EJ110_NYTH52550 [Nymphaea thermarum]
MECAAKGMGTPCTGPATRRCGGCGAVCYCSYSHQISHWDEHKEECGRLKKQMEHVDALCDFPFTFSSEVTSQVASQEVTKCSFLKSQGLHKIGIWTYECRCEQSVALSNFLSWKEYYEWRSLPLCSPVALLLHWVSAANFFCYCTLLSVLFKSESFIILCFLMQPLSIYYGIQLASHGISPGSSGELRIHYLGPEKELHQLPAFGELRLLFPGVHVFIELVGPSIPQNGIAPIDIGHAIASRNPHSHSGRPREIVLLCETKIYDLHGNILSSNAPDFSLIDD